LLPSLLTSLEAKVHMAKASHCRTFICTKETLSLVRTVQREIGDANVVVVPELEELLSVNEAPKYPYTKSWDEAKEDPFAIFHTSGSSGKCGRTDSTVPASYDTRWRVHLAKPRP
jgi:acyl-coenzyme A synthetase/AMP-(fatty) acid ligase